MKKLLTFIKKPINICILYLALLAIFASYSKISSSTDIITNIIFTASTIITINIILPQVLTEFKLKVLNLSNSIVSSLILFLVLDPLQDVYLTVIICFAVLVIRMFVRKNNSPFFNPAVIGVVIASLIAKPLLGVSIFVSWWGVSFAPRITIFDAQLSVALFLTLPFGIYFAYRFRKLFILGSAYIFSMIGYFLVSYIILGRAFDNILTNYLFVFLDGTFIFATAIMLCEPKTSPIKKRDTIIYALLFAVVWSASPLLKLSNSLMLSILAANLYTVAQKLYTQWKMKQHSKAMAAASKPAVTSPTQPTTPPVHI